MLNLKNIQAYTLASHLSDDIWNSVIKWNNLSKNTIGSQLIRSIDSVAANIAEGEGRYFKKEKIKFYYNARGSLYETYHWIEKAKERELITEEFYEDSLCKLRLIQKQSYFLIQNANKNLIK